MSVGYLSKQNFLFFFFAARDVNEEIAKRSQKGKLNNLKILQSTY